MWITIQFRTFREQQRGKIIQCELRGNHAAKVDNATFSLLNSHLIFPSQLAEILLLIIRRLILSNKNESEIALVAFKFHAHCSG